LKALFLSFVIKNNLSQLKDLTPMPSGLRDEYKDLLRPVQRRTMENLLGSRYFKDDYVQSMFFLETIALKDDYEKDAFFKRLAPLLQALPPDVARYKVLPELVKGLDYGTANFRVLGPILDVGASLNDDEFRRTVGASVVKWFASPDRSLRRNLLEHLPAIVARMDDATVNDRIFPHIADGFEDKVGCMLCFYWVSVFYISICCHFFVLSIFLFFNCSFPESNPS
jgi:SCY1-like protein 1